MQAEANSSECRQHSSRQAIFRAGTWTPSTGGIENIQGLAFDISGGCKSCLTAYICISSPVSIFVGVRSPSVAVNKQHETET